MPDNIRTLHVVAPPSVPEEIRADVIRQLEKTLAEARRGEVAEVLLIIQRPDPEFWEQRSSDTQSILKWVGRLEVTKLDWIAKMTAATRTDDDE